MKVILNPLKKTASLFLNRLFSKKLILILGCQRSGTTLLFMMISSHPDIKGINEDEYPFHKYPYWHDLYLSWRNRRYICFKLPQITCDLKYIKRNYPRAKIIWIIRHPFSVISSMRTLKHDNHKNWLNNENSGPVELKNHAKLFSEINKIDLNSIDEITLGSHVWKFKAMTLEKYLDAGLDVHVIKYEDLLENSEKELRNLFYKYKIDFSEQMLHHERHHTGKKYLGNNPGDKPLDKSRINPKLNLTGKEREKVMEICQVQAEKFYSEEV